MCIRTCIVFYTFHTDRLKEELIHELVKTGHSTKQLNSTYLTKIQALEKVYISIISVSKPAWPIYLYKEVKAFMRTDTCMYITM